MNLDANTDRLNEALSMAEERIRALGMRVTASIELPDGERLHFKKHNGEWGLFVERDGALHRIVSATREVRVLAAHSLEALFAAICAEYRSLDREILDAIEAAHAFQPELPR